MQNTQEVCGFIRHECVSLFLAPVLGEVIIASDVHVYETLLYAYKYEFV